MHKELLSKSTTEYESYDDYLEAQTKVGLSYESDNLLWSKGQERYIEKVLAGLPKDSYIADIACGDGVGLKYFKKLGFTDVEGYELSLDKVKKAKVHGYSVFATDIHDLSMIKDNNYDVIYSSHTLEHLIDPVSTLREFKRILKKDGQIFIVLPYGKMTLVQGKHKVHCGVENLGLNIDDEAGTLEEIIKGLGFSVKNKKFDNFREEEVWLELGVL
jgi:ubiquinone/menaquinone biosynthesis C-methylase UbiE